MPEIEIQSDFDGYFESLVKQWIAQKENPFVHKKIIVSAGPWRTAAVSYKSKDGVLYLDFYSALRTGFGQLSVDEIASIIELL